MSVAQAVCSGPVLSPANLGGQWSCQSKQMEHGTGRNLVHFRPLDGRKHQKLMDSSLIRLSAVLANPSTRRSAALNMRCSAAGQTQTVIKQSPTITKAPMREPTKTPEIDDGGPGLPPRDDGGGGGGGGGGGNWSGGFFLFGFLALLGLLKDSENEDK